MYSFYIPRGHSIKELDELSVIEQKFYMRAMEKYYEDIFEMINVVVISYLGSEKEQKEYVARKEREFKERQQAKNKRG